MNRTARAAEAVQRFAAARPRAYAAAAFFGSALLYFVVLEAFLNIDVLNGETQVRPAAGMSPVLGLFFGWPGILGCACANIVSDFVHETTDPAQLALYACIQVVYNALPYVIWYAARRNSAFPYPRLDTVAKIGAYLVLSVLDALVITALLMPLEEDVMQALNIHAVRALNNAIFLVYVGMPLLVVLERSPLVPRAFRRVEERAPYDHRPRMNLTQRLLVGTTLLFAIVLAVFIAIGYGSYFVDGSIVTPHDLAELISSIYVMTSILTVCLYVPIIAVLRHLETHYTRPLETLTDASRDFVAQVARCQAAGTPLSATRLDERGLKLKHEMADLFAATDTMRADIVRYVDELGAVMAERERTAAELDIAARIQNGAVPHDFTSFVERYHLDVAAVLDPAREVGGDFYDVFDAGEHRVGFVIADVSGKGVPAALFMMRALAEIKEQMLANEDVGAAFTAANQRLCEHNDAMLFVTAFACVLDVSTGQLTYANAGHNPPWLRHATSHQWLPCKPGLVMGALDVASYRSAALELQPGDGLFLYTDGVTEAMDKDEGLFGNDRLQDALFEVAGTGAASAVEHVRARVDEFAAGAPQADDITMLSFVWSLPVRSLALPPDERALDDLFAFLDAACAEAGCTKRAQFTMRLVLEELFVNVAHYGFPDGHPRRSVHVEAAVDANAGCVHVSLSDEGIPYDPLSYEPEKVEAGKDNKIGGLGILLSKEMTERMAYERADGKNVVHLVFKIGA